MNKFLMVLFITIVIGICVIGVAQLNDPAEVKVKEADDNPVVEMIQ